MQVSIFRYRFVFYGILLLTSIGYAQELPLVNTYTAEIYQGESQNWGFSQSDSGDLYVANNKGLLVYNGASWRLYETPNETIMRSVHVVKDRIYTGFYMDFGYWVEQDNGVLSYTSLVAENQIEIDADEQFWDIQEVQGWMVFKSLNHLHILHPKNNTYFKIVSDTKIPQLFLINQQLYFQQMGQGLYRVVNGEKVLVSNHHVFKNNEVVGLFSEQNQILVVTKDSGLFLFDGENLKPWNTELNTPLTHKTIYSSYRLKNGNLVLGTISNGAIFLNRNGEILYQLSRKNALQNNTVLSIYEDAQQLVWLGLDNGINSIEVDGAFLEYTDNTGELGTVYAAIMHNGHKYLGTNQGLFVASDDKNINFELIPGTQGQVWSLQQINGALFCGHDLGTFVIKNKKVLQHIQIAGTWKLCPIGGGRLLQGNYSGLYVLEQHNGHWRVKHKIEGFDNSSKSFEIYKNNTIFVNHEYKGVFILEVDSDFKKLIHLRQSKNVEKGLHSGLVLYNNNIVYANRKGVYRYVEEKEDFVREDQLSAFYDSKNYTSGKLINTHNSKTLWSFSKKHLAFTESNNLIEGLRIKTVPIPEKIRKGAAGYENIVHLNANSYLIGRNNGYLLFNKQKWKQEENIDFEIRIDRVETHRLNETVVAQNIVQTGQLNSKENNVNFSFHIASFNKDRSVAYRYRLLGHNTNWSAWAKKSTVFFENLSFGNYTFEVVGKLGNIESSNVASYTFQIARPWYVSNLVIGLYLVVLLLIFWLVNKRYTIYYKKQREILLQEQEREFALANLAREKELMHLKNKQLKTDVSVKNRELASSTMNIIKKNELLGNIKSTLLKGSGAPTKEVIRIIDKNLNHNDDWKLFLEAFNNADKDFIKKLKSVHPDLTPNDLRLCAYLRLNLSSKEIAPLLNISPKSVEVKRYRLRKKMALEHDKNLTTYILDL